MAAAVLVVSLRMSGTTQTAAVAEKPAFATVLVAAQDLPAMSVVPAAAIATTSVSAKEAPDGALSNPVQAVGKVLCLPVRKGQAYTAGDFAQGSALQLAAALPEGKRAVSVSLADYSGLSGLLYPGSAVDVVASFRVQGKAGMPEVVSTTLLENVQVLAVGDTMVTTPTGTSGPVPQAQPAGQKRLVTLLVDPTAARALHLAFENGAVSLSMRNPLDSGRVERTVMRLSDLCPDLRSVDAGGEAVARAPAQPPTAGPSPAVAPPAATMPTLVSAGTSAAAVKPPQQRWVTKVIRGGQVSSVDFPLDSGDSAPVQP
jgi:pilus assembly protein CpaB